MIILTINVSLFKNFSTDLLVQKQVQRGKFYLSGRVGA